jgi:uncharacterized protein YoxC
MEKKNWIKKLDDLEGDKPDSPQKKFSALESIEINERTIMYGLAGAFALILVLLVILFVRTGKDISMAGIDDVYSRIETLERQVGILADREEDRQRFYVQFAQSEQDVKSRLDNHREVLDDLRQKVAELDKAGQRTTAAPPPPRREETRPEPTPEPRPETRTQTTTQDRVIHEVQRGENLFRIGLQYNISVDEIMRLNNLSPNDSIYPGQKLIVGTKNN